MTISFAAARGVESISLVGRLNTDICPSEGGGRNVGSMTLHLANGQTVTDGPGALRLGRPRELRALLDGLAVRRELRANALAHPVRAADRDRPPSQPHHFLERGQSEQRMVGPRLVRRAGILPRQHPIRHLQAGTAGHHRRRPFQPQRPRHGDRQHDPGPLRPRRLKRHRPRRPEARTSCRT